MVEGVRVDAGEAQRHAFLVTARHLVDNINEVHCTTGDAIQGNIARVVKVRKELGIT